MDSEEPVLSKGNSPEIAASARDRPSSSRAADWGDKEREGVAGTTAEREGTVDVWALEGSSMEESGSTLAVRGIPSSEDEEELDEAINSSSRASTSSESPPRDEEPPPSTSKAKDRRRRPCRAISAVGTNSLFNEPKLLVFFSSKQVPIQYEKLRAGIIRFKDISKRQNKKYSSRVSMFDSRKYVSPLQCSFKDFVSKKANNSEIMELWPLLLPEETYGFEKHCQTTKKMEKGFKTVLQKAKFNVHFLPICQEFFGLEISSDDLAKVMKRKKRLGF
jgi:hypothetical protein